MPILERAWMLEAMRMKGWDRARLAVETGIDYPRICEYISGNRRPRPEKAKIIAAKLGISWTLFYEESQDIETAS